MITAFLFAAAVAQNAPRQVQMFGIGLDSCAHWLQTPSLRREGETWALGYWSGLNVNTTTSPTVGRHTDPDGVIGEIRKVCEGAPSLPLALAINQAYDAMATVGR